MDFYQRKLYALLHNSPNNNLYQLPLQELQKGWNDAQVSIAAEIGSSSDRINLKESTANNSTKVEVRHPISGEKQDVDILDNLTEEEIKKIRDAIAKIPSTDTEKLFWWFWRFYPELLAQKQSDGLLFPAHKILPDCPLHSYNSTVSAITGALFSPDWKEQDNHETPYLFLFTFSPVQEFIKSSRKFLDFWAGSYLLHYLGVKLCWHIARKFGPDAIITPSLWSQEIIDALIIQELDVGAVFEDSFRDYCQMTPVDRFSGRESTSLSTAGFPNVITALVPGKDAAEKLGKELAEKLKAEWLTIGEKIRLDIRKQVIKTLEEKWPDVQKSIEQAFPHNTDNYLQEIELLKNRSCWEWRKLWEAQLSHTWEPYWAAIPLGIPSENLSINQKPFDEWIASQQDLSQSSTQLPSQIEQDFYDTLNVGTWWGSLQYRLGQCLQAVKNTRVWQIPASPGERSTLSGQFTAAHPRFQYQDSFREGGGLPESSMRLFWLVMAEAYPGLFNGSEKLNCLELTKRMAWEYGGVAESLGINIKDEEKTANSIDYENLIRFPNLSSIAAARFAFDYPEKIRQYWHSLNQLCREKLPEERDRFGSRTRRPFQVPKTDNKINPTGDDGNNYNGVMFSSKWLADDMGLREKDNANTSSQTGRKKIEILREIVDTAHKKTGFTDGSPSDWWVIVLGDGDGMGRYVSGQNLEKYSEYIVDNAVEQNIRNSDDFKKLMQQTKRMGPATHVGLNRALLDFSNRLVPYLTEHRFCGKVIYSGGDDVMAVLPLEDLPKYLLSLRAAWCGGKDPYADDPLVSFTSEGGYWYPIWKTSDRTKLPDRPHFTMGKKATMSFGIVIAHKSIPLPTVLESIWEAEKVAKAVPGKDGLCFRVIYGGGNQLEAVMKGTLLSDWWNFIKDGNEDLSPLLYRLAEELPRRAAVTPNYHLFSKAAKVIISRRDESKKISLKVESLTKWLDDWEDWVKNVLKEPEENDKKDSDNKNKKILGTEPEDLGKLLRFSAFWVDKIEQRKKWGKS
jgi:CRISPR-associated protein Cmr2